MTTGLVLRSGHSGWRATRAESSFRRSTQLRLLINFICLDIWSKPARPEWCIETGLSRRSAGREGQRRL